MSIITLWENFKTSKWYSRKLLVVVAGTVLVILFPESSAAIVSVVGLFCGANVASKFSPAIKEITQAVDAAKDIVEETTKTENN